MGYSGAHGWVRRAGKRPHLLDFSPELLINPDAAGVSRDGYPDVWRQGELVLPLSYEFDPGSADDGVTVHIPLAVLNQVEGAGFDWQVPGLREELVTAWIRSLPKPLRRNFIPVPEFVEGFLAETTPDDEPLLPALAAYLTGRTRDRIPSGSWQADRIPSHLTFTFRVEDSQGRTLAKSKDLDALKARLQRSMRSALAPASAAIEQTGLTSWSFGVLPRTVEAERSGHVVRGYPAVVDEGDTVAVRVLASEAEQARAMWDGTRRLLLLTTPSIIGALNRRLTTATKLALARRREHTLAGMLDDAVTCAVDEIIAANGGPARDGTGFDRLREAVTANLLDDVTATVTRVGIILDLAHAIEGRAEEAVTAATAPSIEDIRTQLGRLVHPGFISEVGTTRLVDITRYLRAIERRLDKLPSHPVQDQQRMRAIQRLEAEYAALRNPPPPGVDLVQLVAVRWMLEELRVSTFAQMLGTAYPVSEERVRRALRQLQG